jgi:hypothetical protein
MAAGNSDRLERARRNGRRAGILAYGVIVGGFTVVCAAQIINQVWGSRPASSSSVDCRAGVRGLIAAVRRSRHAARIETAGERAAVDRFRAALRPEWTTRNDLAQHCKDDRLALRALREVDRLRFAEEHAVRYESVDLARRRRNIRRFESQLAAAPSSSSPRGSPQ